jgi:hypothetical protein
VPAVPKAATNGEGCFTASLTVDSRAKWGVQPQAEFNITQKRADRPLLDAINRFFDNKGGVFLKPNDMAVVSFRRTSTLKTLIIPFFLEYPLLTTKSYEFERWCSLIDILCSQKHIGDSLSAKQAFLDFTRTAKELNSKRNTPNKEVRADVIIEWLESLSGVPSKDTKLELMSKIKQSSNRSQFNLHL